MKKPTTIKEAEKLLLKAIHERMDFIHKKISIPSNRYHKGLMKKYVKEIKLLNLKIKEAQELLHRIKKIR